MNFIHRSVLFFLVGFLVACAVQVDPTSLQAATSGKSIFLPRGYTYLTAPGGIYDQRMRYELAAGTYAAELVDDQGAYFRGPDGCFSFSIAASTNKSQPLNQAEYFQGGVYVPRNPQKAARIYRYQLIVVPDTFVTSGVAQTATNAVPAAPGAAKVAGSGLGAGVVAGIIANGRGKIVFLPDRADGAVRAAIAAN